MNLSTLAKSFALAGSLLVSSVSFAANIDMNADANDVAIKGYDTVSYFYNKTPSVGSEKYTATYKNAIYKFSSAKNRDLFRANPEKYTPQFGGYCAMGVALEKKLDTDPLAYKVVDGKLYLNLNAAVQKKWLTDVPGYIDTAEDNWGGIKDRSVAEVNAD